jgi:hypothetical protein
MPLLLICLVNRCPRIVKAFCNEIGSTLRALEEGTPWANTAELHIGLLKEVVMNDIKVPRLSNSLLGLLH